MSELRTLWLEVEGTRVRTVAGGTGTPIVFVHGFGVSGAYMLPLARLLANTHTVLVPDLPRASIINTAEALGALLDAAQLVAPAAVANSLGCQTVTELAVRRPGRLGPLVLIGPTIEPARRGAPHQLLGLLRDAKREPFSLISLATRNIAAEVGPLLRTVRAALADRIEDRLPLVEQRAVVVYGEADGFVSREWAAHVAELLPRGRLVTIPGEPHAVHYTQPELLAGIVDGLLVEEGEHRGGKLPRHLEHRNVAAGHAREPGAWQEPLPLLRQPKRHEPIPVAPDEERRRLHGAQLVAQIAAQHEHHSVGEAQRTAAHDVGTDHRQPPAYVVQRVHQ
jgi:pimeloyl-ACP methyl ester carboxylesterase